MSFSPHLSSLFHTYMHIKEVSKAYLLGHCMFAESFVKAEQHQNTTTKMQDIDIFEKNKNKMISQKYLQSP